MAETRSEYDANLQLVAHRVSQLTQNYVVIIDGVVNTQREYEFDVNRDYLRDYRSNVGTFNS
jgi:hypothetical protein